MRRPGTAAATALLAIFALAARGHAGGEWKAAGGERPWSFPDDHGAHRDYRTEWWYFTGQLKSPDGRAFGFQLTFFRFGASANPVPAGNPWALRDLYAAHFAVTDLEAGRFAYAERLSREGPGLASGQEGGLAVRILDWAVEDRGGEIALHAADEGMELELRLAAGGEPLLHGRGGLSLKGDGPGQSSWYYSVTDFRARGAVRTPWTGSAVPVEGWSWFDHEFGSNQLSEAQTGWDWFSLRLADGRRVMLYLLRRRDGTVEPLSSGTLREPDGTAVHLSLGDFAVEEAGKWRSPGSGALYPSGWRVRIPSAGIDLEVGPLLPDQELATSRSTSVTYWEGAVSGRGSSGGAEVAAEGYVELTGYAGSLGGLF